MPPSSVICIDQHRGYDMATIIYQLPASGQKRVSLYYVPSLSLVSMDQHSGYCMATSIHQVPVSGQRRASWYYVPP